MDLQYSASRILHDDHMASLGLLTELERLVLTKKAPPPADDPEIARFLARLRGALAGEIVAHFDFEEEVLFPVLIESGQGDLIQVAFTGRCIPKRKSLGPCVNRCCRL